MTVRVNKDSFNLREKLSELERPIGLKGSDLMKSETAQEARDLVSAGRKNIIINGNMMISQRFGYNNVQTVSNERHLDRFTVRDTTVGTLQVKQSPASGSPFDNVMELNCTGADTTVTSDYVRIQYLVEGHDLRGIDWGKANSKDYLTLSFWVKTNAPGDYHVNIENTSSGYFPLMVKKYTIKNSNEWQKVVVTFPPPPGEYTFERGNGRGMAITWALAVGSSYNGATDGAWRTSGYHMSTSTQRNFMDTSGNNFYITGVQLERGKNATDFEHRPYGEELALCQRYYQSTNRLQAISAPLGQYGDTAYTGWQYDSNAGSLRIRLPVEMRVGPAATVVGIMSASPGADGTIGAYGSSGWMTLSSITATGTTPLSVRVNAGGMSGAGKDAFGLYFYGTYLTSTIKLDAEL